MHDGEVIDITKILNDYSTDIQEALQAEAIATAREAVAELKNTSPKRTGKYRKGWRVQTTKSRYEIECEIYNENAGLTVLLEKPHHDRTGKRIITPRSAGHIARVEEKYVKKFENEAEKIIQNGGK